MLAERVMEWTAQWKAEGHLEGRLEGQREGQQTGQQQGRLEMLQMQLEVRFGNLPDWALARLSAASTEELTRWGLRLMTQNSLPEVLS